MTSTNSTPTPVRDVVIVGGGAAGLSAALTLARARRAVTVIDAGHPRNAPAAAAHGLLGNEGISPLALLARGRTEAQSYGAEVRHARVTSATAHGTGFLVTLDDGQELAARQLLVATGARDLFPDIPGLREHWGRDVVHCPYCNGWEIRDQHIALVATGPMSAHQALLFHQWSTRVSFITNELDFGTEELAKLAALNIPVVDEQVTGLEIADDKLTGVRLADGRSVPVDVVALPTQVEANLEGLTGLHLDTATSPVGTVVQADASGQTSVPGVWAAGNVVSPAHQISEAAANGARVAMTINTTLVFADAETALTTATSKEA